MKNKIQMNDIQLQHLSTELTRLKYPPLTELLRIPHSTSTDNYKISFKDQPSILARYFRTIPSDPSYEFRIMSILSNHNIPVPEQFHFIEAHDGNDPFVLMEFVEGSLLGELTISVDLYEQYIKILANIHTLNWQEVFPKTKVSKDINETYARVICERRVHDAKQFNLTKEVKPVMKWMKDHTKLKIEHLSLLHGDYHPFNIVVRPTSQLAVLDWEGLDIGDNRRDLAFALLTAGSVGGRKLEQELLALYRSYGLPTSNMDFYYVSNAFHRVVKLNRMLTPDFARYDIYSKVYYYLKDRIEEITDCDMDLDPV